MGECGHAHKASIPIADRVVPKELHVPSESAMVLLEDLVCNEKIKVDPSRNDFPVTLHDPCNITRSMGIVQPQRNILKRICPQFREMEPHGVNNLCCGGGSGFFFNHFTRLQSLDPFRLFSGFGNYRHDGSYRNRRSG